jgi:hypothetical protein
MRPTTALQQIIVVPESAATKFDVPGNPREHFYLELRPNSGKRRALIIAPHHHEAWLNAHLFKIALFCRAADVQLIAIGHENQLPFFGMFADAVILQRGPLDSLFGWYSTFATDSRGFDALTGFVDVYAHDTLPWELFPDEIFRIVPDARLRFVSPWRAIYGHYTQEHIVGVFSDCNIFVQQKSREIFDQLNAENKLPKNSLWCEVKENYGKVNARLELLRQAGLPIVGLDKTLQKQLVKNHGPAFMTLQILSSIYNDCRMILGAGSAHVFAVAPVNIAMALAPADRFYNSETEHIVRKFNLHRFGSVPYVEEATLTWMATEDARQFSAKLEHDNVAHWQLDYFLDADAMRAYLTAAQNIPAHTNVVEQSYDCRHAAFNVAAFTAGRPVQFARHPNAVLGELTLLPDGRIQPANNNETYWNQVGNQLAFKTELGQVSTVFFPDSDTQLSGNFIYNNAVRHKLNCISIIG